MQPNVLYYIIIAFLSTESENYVGRHMLRQFGLHEETTCTDIIRHMHVVKIINYYYGTINNYKISSYSLFS